MWTDPEFDRAQRAFYYARVRREPDLPLEHAGLCNEQGVDCAVPASIPPGFAECCNPSRPTTIQERAWTSPIWYRPEGIARCAARSASAPAIAGTDVLRLTLRRSAPCSPTFDPTANDLTVEVSDDDVIYSVTIPAGTLQPGATATSTRIRPAVSAASSVPR